MPTPHAHTLATPYGPPLHATPDPDAIHNLAELPNQLTYDEVARLVRVTKNTLRRLWKSGRFPQPIQYNQRLLRWNRDEIIAWMRSQKAPLDPLAN